VYRERTERHQVLEPNCNQSCTVHIYTLVHHTSLPSTNARNLITLGSARRSLCLHRRGWIYALTMGLGKDRPPERGEFLAFGAGVVSAKVWEVFACARKGIALRDGRW
jgi:hypothetical protein